MTTWDGVSPLTPDHEVAYRKWPTERVRIKEVDRGRDYPVLAIGSDGERLSHTIAGKFRLAAESPYDLVPLQKEPDHE